MATPPLIRRLLAPLVLVAGCTSDTPVTDTPVAATATALDSTTVEVTFTSTLIPVTQPVLRIFAPLSPTAPDLEVVETAIDGATLRVTTAPQVGGRTYAMQFGELTFQGVARPDAPAQVNFEGFGTTSVTVSLDTTGFLVPEGLVALVTYDPATKSHSNRFSEVPMSDPDGDQVYTASVELRIDKRNVFAARARTQGGAAAGALGTFTTGSTTTVTLPLTPLLERVPEFDAPSDPVVGDGFAPVRLVFDDRFARELTRPELRSSLSAGGQFDIATTRVDPLLPVPGKSRVYETILSVAVDPNRRLDGTTQADFPYVAFLIEDGEDIPQRGTSFAVLDETPQVIVIPMGNPDMVPVTFRIDAGSAVLNPQANLRGLYPGEGLFLTGEFPGSEDALGRLAADAFSGGERATLEMNERPDAPGIYEKTVFMNPNRPYGWKVVRCPTGVGCGELNRHVASSGRAFPTVMKNLVTQNADAAGNSAVRVIDPANLDRVTLENGDVADYSGARVSIDGMEAASPTVMFKQEAPDLVVMVGFEPLTTPTYIVGTWRDVNIDDTPTEIIATGGTLNLAPFDYDDGLVGIAPLQRDRTLPVDPGAPMPNPGEPAFDATDGQVDRTARQLTAPGRLPLWVAWNEESLYVATEPAVPGQDRFIIVSLDDPMSDRPAQWSKGGTSAASTRTAFLAMEGDGDFSGWFRRGAMGTDDMLVMGLGVDTGRGTIVEGAIDFSEIGIGATGERVWIAVVAYGTRDGDPLDPALQNPEGNGDFNLTGDEFMPIVLGEVRAQ